MYLNAIQTEYNGYTFRSRTEARWAVFMDHLGVPYDYEQEGFDLGDAGKYLPDFWLRDFDSWMEVKPYTMNSTERIKAIALAKTTGKLVFVFYSCCDPKFDKNFEFHNTGHYFAPDGEFDGIMQFGFCRLCDKPTLGHLGGHRVFCRSEFDYKGGCRSESLNTDKDPRVLAAFKAAKSARFEFGQTPHF